MFAVLFTEPRRMIEGALFLGLIFSFAEMTEVPKPLPNAVQEFEAEADL